MALVVYCLVLFTGFSDQSCQNLTKTEKAAEDHRDLPSRHIYHLTWRQAHCDGIKQMVMKQTCELNHFQKQLKAPRDVRASL